MMYKNQKSDIGFRSIGKIIAYTFIQVNYHSRTGRLGEDFSHLFDLDVNSYPCDLTNATNMIINHKNYVNNPNHTGKKNEKSKKNSKK